MKIGLLELLQFKVGCDYISDFKVCRYCNKAVKHYLDEIDLNDYPFEEVNEVIKYIYDTETDFSDLSHIEKFIKQQKEEK